MATRQQPESFDEFDPPADRFEHQVLVQADVIDVNGHANNVVFVRWIQDVAVAHWFAVVEPEQARAVSWVVVRHEIDYKRPALVNDRLLVQTWVGEISAATCERFCEIRRAGEDQILARSRTVWCMVDPTSGRPKRIGPEIRNSFFGRWPNPDDQAGGSTSTA